LNSLILFPTKQENPFPVGLKLGKVFQLKNNVFLLFTGIGEKGAELLDNFLINNSFDGQIIEFGGAASVLGGEVGEIYEIVEILNDVESVIVHQQTFLKKASLFCKNKLFTGEELNVSRDILLFSMETLFFYKVAQKYGLNFISIRIVTDFGKGNIKKEFIKTLELNRKKIKTVLEDLL
jgi:hypothetical protein